MQKKNTFPVEGFNLESLMESLFYKDEFLSIASHELKTPLTAMKLQAQVFKRRAGKEDHSIAYSKEKVDLLIEQIDIHATRMVNLINDMLDISRIRSGQLVMTKNHFNLSDLLNDVSVRFNQHGVTSEIYPNILFYGDRERIEQVFSKLLNNALKYGKSLPIFVKLERKKSKISFSIQDQGQGISPEDQKRIFYRFQRAVAASEVSGMGLGLYIAKEIVEAHNGKIIIKSTLGKGSTFNVEFKLGVP